MLTHYLKIAVRQLLKYKPQSCFCIVSLAIGFACFSLAILWIRYVITYDNNHRGADRLYCITTHIGSPNSYAPTGEYLLKHCPEIEAQASFLAGIDNISVDGKNLHQIQKITCDSNFLSLFNIPCIEGNDKFYLNKNEIAVTDEFARKIWGEKSPIGKQLKTYSPQTEYTVTAVVKGYGQHVNFPFDCLFGNTRKKEWCDLSWYNIIRVCPETDKETFVHKIDTLVVRGVEYGEKDDLHIVPLTELFYTFPHNDKQVQLDYIILFSIASGLVILCALLNYLTLFINRIFIRKREIALRTVLGSSKAKILKLLFCEFLLMLLFSLLAGMIFIELVFPHFHEITNVSSDSVTIYMETLLYSVGMMLITFLLSIIPISYFIRKQNLSIAIGTRNRQRSYYLFRKLSIGVQLTIGIGFTFCTVVMILQINEMRHTYIGFQRDNIAIIRADNPTILTRITDYLQQQPEFITGYHNKMPIFPLLAQASLNLYPKGEENTGNQCYIMELSENHLKFYGITLIEGEWLKPEDGNKKALINEAAAKILGWEHPVGKQIATSCIGMDYTIIGVVKDFLNESPISAPKPYIFANESGFKMYLNNFIFKYLPGTWPDIKKKIEALFPDNKQQIYYALYNCEKEYDKLLQTEQLLQQLLSVISAVCVLIALFGIYSMIMLTCEQRRKEIAIRKVNGATVKNILGQFFHEYMVLLLGAATIAFPIGYICMKLWLENYIIQTKISWWIYLSIFAGIAILVLLCIGYRVWRAANSNPAEEIRKE